MLIALGTCTALELADVGIFPSESIRKERWRKAKCRHFRASIASFVMDDIFAATIAGLHAEELISEITLAMKNRIRLTRKRFEKSVTGTAGLD